MAKLRRPLKKTKNESDKQNKTTYTSKIKVKKTNWTGLYSSILKCDKMLWKLETKGKWVEEVLSKNMTMEMIIQHMRWLEMKLDNSGNSVGTVDIQITDGELWKAAVT